ncbi:MAG: TolC family protein [Chitinophagaceae bacterium]|nr:MAG: TolC family protein [Chitinophagaceae bacterium]
MNKHFLKAWPSKAGLLVLLAFAMGELQAQTTHSFTAKQAADYAQKNAIAVKNALIDIKIQEQTNRGVTSAAFPQLNGSVNVSYNPNIAVQSLPDFISPATYQVLIDQGVKDGNGQPIAFPAGGFGNIAAQFGVPWTAGAGLELSQLLFDGQVFVGLQARKTVLDFARKQAEVTQESIKANVYKVYYQLVVGRQQITSIDANIERFDKLLNDTREIFKQGFAEKLDVDKVQVQLNNLRTEKVKAINQLRVGDAGLKFLMNIPQRDSLILTDSLTEAELKDNVLDQQYNYNDRKEYQLLSLGLKLREFDVKRYQLSRIPTLAAFASYQKNAQRQKFDFFNDGPWFTASLVGVKLNVPIFDGFARRSKIQSAKLEVEKSKNNLAQQQENIDNEVTASRLSMTSALQTIDAQRQNVELAEKVYNTTKLKYEQGLGNNQEIYNAQAELKVAQNNYYSALYDAIVAKVDYLKATGKLQ